MHRRSEAGTALDGFVDTTQKLHLTQLMNGRRLPIDPTASATLAKLESRFRRGNNANCHGSLNGSSQCHQQALQQVMITKLAFFRVSSNNPIVSFLKLHPQMRLPGALWNFLL